jgi:hypothetical protein
MRGNNLKEIIIRLGSGTIQDGFSNVTVELKSAKITRWEDRSSLPPNPELQQLLNQWQLLYPAAIQMLSTGLNLSPVFDADTVTNVSTQDMVELNYNFRIAIDRWLSSSDFGRIDRRLRTDLNITDRLVVIIVSDRLQIWQLPWHFWDLFSAYHQATEVFAKPRSTDVSQIKPQHDGKVNILTLSGRDPRLTLDLPFLKTLPQAYSQPLETTSAYAIADRLNNSQPWDILIFNGHGDTIQYQSVQDGIIYLDNDTPLEISRLKIEIQKAVDRGLQIAIFNCCNGLGLAEQLSDINIPYIIVMREIVPNQCAQDFLKQLLDRYSRGDSFPAAFKYARQSLRLSPGGFAQFADWLPILFHNPLSNDVTWQDLSATVFSRTIPPQIIAFCRYFGQPNHRVLVNVGLGLLTSLLALSLQSHPQIVTGETAIVDRIQATQVEKMTLEPSKVTIVNYDLIMINGNNFADDRVFRQFIEQVQSKAKPIAWAINFKFDNNPTIFDNHVIQGCIDENLTNSSPQNKFQLTNCDRQLVANLAKTSLDWSVPEDFKLNINLLTGNNYQIDRVNLTDIAQGSKSEAEIKKIFDHKFVIVGYFDGKEINSVAREAIGIDQIIRANDKQHPLPLLIYRAIGEQFLWIFTWSILTGTLMWKRKWKLFLLLTIVSEIAIAIILLSLGQGLPIVVTPIAMILVGVTVRGMMAIGRHQIVRQPA